MDWKQENNQLVKTYHFKDFAHAIRFMQHCQPKIDALNHHPEWTNVYNRIEVRLCTHDAGNQITSKDTELAQLLDECYTEMNEEV